MNNNAVIDPISLEHIVKLFGTKDDLITFVGGFQNLVYEYQQDGTSYMLRLTPAANRTEGLVQSELDWILYLAGHGIPVSKPIRSVSGRWTEAIHMPGKGSYTCAVFEKALGAASVYPECLHDTSLYERLGRLTGKLHALSKLYQPRGGLRKRHEWSSNWFLQNISMLPHSQAAVQGSCSRLVTTIASLPKDTSSYGLIHGDINVGNFRIQDNGEIKLFDFDEAQYSWFVEDLAVQLYYLVYVYGGVDGEALREDQASRFMQPFLKGYLLEHELDEYWLRQLPLFLRLRELIVYIGAFRNWEGDDTFSQSDNQWFKDWIAESRYRIENDIPIVDIWSRPLQI